MPGCPAYLVLLSDEVLHQIIFNHEILATRVLTGVTSYLPYKIRVICQRKILNQCGFSCGFTADNQNLSDIVIPAHLWNILPMRRRPLTDLCRGYRNLRPVKVHDLTLRTVQALKPAGSKIIRTTEHCIYRLSYRVLDILCSLFPIIIRIIFFF